MRKFLIGAVCIALALLAGCNSAKAQNVRREGNTFISDKSAKTITNDIATSYLWKDTKGIEHPIFLHKFTKGDKAGQYGAYVLKKSAKSGKEYKYFIPNNAEIVSTILKETGI